jgi:hypothetical protein
MCCRALRSAGCDVQISRDVRTNDSGLRLDYGWRLTFNGYTHYVGCDFQSVMMQAGMWPKDYLELKPDGFHWKHGA